MVNETRDYDVIVIGAGPAGIMALYAILGDLPSLRVALIEKERRPLRKFKITGKGRCNLTNSSDFDTFIAELGGCGRFFRSSFFRFDNERLVSFFNSIGVSTRIERGNRVFPADGSAMNTAISLFDTLKSKYSPTTMFNTRVHDIEKVGKFFKISTTKGRFFSKKLLVATGGITYPLTGSDGSIFPVLKKIGHTIISPKHALCGMKTTDSTLLKLRGVSLKNCNVSIYNNNKKVGEEFGELLYTGDGVSGPTILRLSRLYRALFTIDGKSIGNVEIIIDLKPALDFQKLEKRILRDIENSPKKKIANILDKLTISSIMQHICSKFSINRDIKSSEFPKKMRKLVIKQLKEFRIPICNLDNIDSAIITIGGVSLKEIDPKTMESKLIPSLYFAGEVMDLDGPTGGYNLQIAFSTGFVAGKAIAYSLNGEEK